MPLHAAAKRPADRTKMLQECKTTCSGGGKPVGDRVVRAEDEVLPTVAGVARLQKLVGRLPKSGDSGYGETLLGASCNFVLPNAGDKRIY